jgi:hypothetical protein
VRKFLKRTFERWINPVIQVDRQPTRATWILLILSNLIRLRKPSVQNANRFYFANQVPARELADHKSPPSISALIVSTRKDFNLLKICLEHLIEGSINPIQEVTVIVPSNDLDICKELIEASNLNFKVKILNEDEVIPIGLRTRVKNKFGDRYGWVLQQLLTVEFVLTSGAPGILVLDSDTVLSQKLLWLDKSGNQLLMPSWEFHVPYYEFLAKIAPKIPYSKSSFISHHMLMQPEILRAIFANLGLNSIEDLFCLAEKFARTEENSPICLEFELYAQGILTFFPQRCLITKWSNISLSFEHEPKMLEQLEMLLQNKKYRSISVHSWSQK